jgi:hypothetical protein
MFPLKTLKLIKAIQYADITLMIPKREQKFLKTFYMFLGGVL